MDRDGRENGRGLFYKLYQTSATGAEDRNPQSG